MLEKQYYHSMKNSPLFLTAKVKLGFCEKDQSIYCEQPYFTTTVNEGKMHNMSYYLLLYCTVDELMDGCVVICLC